jgi:hypothetical protein
MLIMRQIGNELNQPGQKKFRLQLNLRFAGVRGAIAPAAVRSLFNLKSGDAWRFPCSINFRNSLS